MTEPDTPDTLRTAIVPDSAAGRRFDAALAELFPEFSRSRLTEWIKSGNALLDGQVVRPRDPNDIIGPEGFGEERWVAASATQGYMIRFENAADASAPAQKIRREPMTSLLETETAMVTAGAHARGAALA